MADEVTEVDEVELSVVPPNNGEDEMPAPDPAMDLGSESHGHWKERLYHLAEMTREGHHFYMEQSRSTFLEGKVGFRESIAMKNIPPVASTGSVPP